MLRDIVNTDSSRMPSRRQSTWVFCLQIVCIAYTCLGLCMAKSGSESSNSKRNITSTFNEGCNISFCLKPQGKSFVNVFHVTAVGENDTIHVLWSSYGALTGLVVRTKHDASLQIDWDIMQRKERNTSAITFHPEGSVLFSSATIFNRLIEYNDSTDTADLRKSNVTKMTQFETFDWQNFNSTIDSEDHTGTFLSHQNGGNISLMVQSFEDDSRGEVLPRLQCTSNSSYFELALSNLSTAFLKSRFAIELLFVGRGKQNFSTSKSIADQYTPSVFYVDNIKFGESDGGQGGYVSWKPVVYTQKMRDVTDGKMVRQYGLNTTSDPSHLPAYSIAHAFYGDLDQIHVSSMNLSFGNDGDDPYSGTKFAVWGGLIGYGEAPIDGLSLLIIVVISAGLGLPALMIVGGGSVLCLKRLTQRKKYEALVVDPGVN